MSNPSPTFYIHPLYYRNEFSFVTRLYYVPYHPLRLELSRVQKRELLLFMKSTRDKEEYRRAYAVKQKMEGVPYRTIAKDMGVNYRNVYDWIDNYRKYGLRWYKKQKKKWR